LKHWFIICLILLAGCRDIVLDNGEIEVHLSQAGGSISHVSQASGPNMVNNHDLGRQIQQSFYAGDLKRHPDQHPAWSPWPWNIVQSGDVYGNEATMIPLFVTPTRAVLMSTPMLWDRNNQREYCATLINDVTLIGNKIRVHVVLILSYECEIINPKPHHQEMPAVYAESRLNKLLSGEQEIQSQGNLLWEYWTESERWAGAFGANGMGLAVYMESVEMFIGGRYENGADKTTYFAPLKTITLKPGDTLTYTYWIVVGTVQDVKQFIMMR
jgi:hypothetical protein